MDLDNPYVKYVVGGVAAYALYYIVSSWFSGDDNGRGHNDEPERPPPPKLERLPIGRITKEELSQYTGLDGSRILISICGRLFDMGAGRDFYGPNGPYSCFVGGDASYMLGAMSLNEQDRNKTEFEVDGDHQMTLGDWIARFRAKYPIVGRLEGYEHLCPESWSEAGPEDGKVSENENIMNGTSEAKVDTMSLEELAGCGNDVVAVAGYVFNVSGAEFVYAPFYGDFPGAIRHDISVAIATNDFSQENYNKPIDSIKDNKEAIERMVRALRAFRDTYPIVGKLSDAGFQFNEDIVDWDIVQKNEQTGNPTESNNDDNATAATADADATKSS